MNLNNVDISKLPADVRKTFKRLQVMHAEKKIQNKAKSDFLSFVKCVWPEFVEGAHHRHIAKKFNELAEGATGPGNQSYVEHYNGIGWAAGGAMPTTRQDGGGAGTETAGLVWCGEGPAKLNTTAEYDGSSWTVTNT